MQTMRLGTPATCKMNLECNAKRLEPMIRKMDQDDNCVDEQDELCASMMWSCQEKYFRTWKDYRHDVDDLYLAASFEHVHEGTV